MTSGNLVNLYPRLLSLRCDGPNYPEAGICPNVNPNVNGEWGAWLRRHFERWPEFSGSLRSPVPHPDSPDAEEGYADDPAKWSGPYGDARYRLLDFLIDQAREELQCSL